MGTLLLVFQVLCPPPTPSAASSPSQIQPRTKLEFQSSTNVEVTILHHRYGDFVFSDVRAIGCSGSGVFISRGRSIKFLLVKLPHPDRALLRAMIPVGSTTGNPDSLIFPDTCIKEMSQTSWSPSSDASKWKWCKSCTWFSFFSFWYFSNLHW